MAEKLVEGSIYNQIKAMEGWALQAYEATKPAINVGQIIVNLKMIDLQGRKLEWRGGGLKDLPKGELANDLRRKVAEIRAAARTILVDAEKYTGLFGDFSFERVKKRTKVFKALVAETVQARKLVEQFAKQLPDLKEIIKGKDKEKVVLELEYFFHGQRDYVIYALDVRRKLWNEFSKKNVSFEMTGIDLSGCDLHGFDFSEKKITHCSFSRTNLMGASFFKSRIIGTEFVESNLEGVNFGEGIIAGVKFVGVKARKTNFTGATFSNVSFNGNFDDADFSYLRKAKISYPSMMLDGVSFINSKFRGAEMIWWLKSPISLANADLREAKIEICVDCRIVHLSKVGTFIGANVAKSEWTYANDDRSEKRDILENALKEAKNSESVKLKGIFVNRNVAP